MGAQLKSLTSSIIFLLTLQKQEQSQPQNGKHTTTESYQFIDHNQLIILQQLKIVREPQGRIKNEIQFIRAIKYT